MMMRFSFPYITFINNLFSNKSIKEMDLKAFMFKFLFFIYDLNSKVWKNQI